MKFELIESMLLDNLREAAKILHMDQSHSATRQNLQRALAVDHRQNNPEDDPYSYPYVQDVYGDGETGQVIHSKAGQHTMSDYAKDGKGYKLSNHRAVKPAYVTVKNDKEEQSESIVYLDGQPVTLAAKESLISDQHEELINLREACFDANGNGQIKLIAPGHGSTGYYSPEVLKEACTKGVFDNAQMFIDHATDEEEAARPEGSVRALAAKAGKASYQEAGPEGPGVYAQAQAYPDTKDFLNSRAADIGVSIRAMGRGIAGQVAGRVNKIVKSLDVLKSCDFVTRAGAGGKLVPLLESFRSTNQRPPAANQKENKMAKVEIEDTELAALKESAAQLPKLQLKVDRNDERFNRIEARDQASAYLKESKLPAPAQGRLLKMVTASTFALPVKDGVLDAAAFTETMKALVTDEAAYLKESGAGLKLVTGLGDQHQEAPTDDDKKFVESQKADDKEFDGLIGNLSGVPRKEKTA